ncbi:uncharacterized protein LOC115740553 isoform X2 [Rhodamnia argentea]|uniref:Uncharacterized protein LOC115740553 isoform X2 n=1 Tax=Rhodamnia argentea TaxID=178133 RepID=A0A8B8P4Y4_9MYRT|nr:uncharacterized protein LOC115740553 isoform X2 [Rhodamnia argentea]
MLLSLSPCASTRPRLHFAFADAPTSASPCPTVHFSTCFRANSRSMTHVAKASRGSKSGAPNSPTDEGGGMVIDFDEEKGEETKGFSSSGGGFRGREEEEKKYDRDPEFAEILGSCLDDPQKARSKMEERLRKKRNKILHAKTGSAEPMKVKFNKFDFSNSYMWFEFYNAPLPKDISLLCDTIRSWHIVGRLGGCNSMNMQLSQSPLDKRPNYDAIQGANVTPTTFYNIGDLEIQDNLACICYVGIKQVVFGGSEFESWKENLTSEDMGYSVHKI